MISINPNQLVGSKRGTGAQVCLQSHTLPFREEQSRRINAPTVTGLEPSPNIYVPHVVVARCAFSLQLPVKADPLGQQRGPMSLGTLPPYTTDLHHVPPFLVLQLTPVLAAACL